MTPLLTIHQCSICFGQKAVVSDVSLSADAGSFVALIGPNGAGKSSLLRAIAGIIPHAAGSIRLASTEVALMTPAQRARMVAMVSQQTVMPEGFTVREVIEMARYAYRPWYASASIADTEAVDRALMQCEIMQFADVPATQLSGGEQQRVAVARAIAQESQILILDEATAHLDLHHQAAILRISREMTHRGVLVIAAMHDLNLAAAYATHIILLDNGRVAAQGTPADVLQQVILERVYRTALISIPLPDAPYPLYILDHSQSL